MHEIRTASFDYIAEKYERRTECPKAFPEVLIISLLLWEQLKGFREESSWASFYVVQLSYCCPGVPWYRFRVLHCLQPYKKTPREKNRTSHDALADCIADSV